VEVTVEMVGVWVAGRSRFRPMQGASDSGALRPRLRRALLEAMRARDRAAVPALRSALAAIDNAEAVAVQHAATSEGVVAGALTGLRAGEAPRRQLSEAEVVELVRAEVAGRRTAAAEYRQLGDSERASRLTAEADTLAALLADADADAGTDADADPGTDAAEAGTRRAD
jgi:uncharacterized protein YqeY